MTHKTKQNPYQTHFSYAKPFGSFRRMVETGMPGLWASPQLTL